MDELTQQIIDAAASAVALNESRPGGGFDYTSTSLAIVEDMLAEASQFAAALTSNQVTTLVQNFGSYILEVGRREFGGRYQWNEQRDQPVLVVGEPAHRIAMMTWNRVRGRLRGDVGDNIPFFYAGFADRVRKAVSDDDALYV